MYVELPNLADPPTNCYALCVFNALLRFVAAGRGDWHEQQLEHQLGGDAGPEGAEHESGRVSAVHAGPDAHAVPVER